jgi:hypothetical protein
MYDVKAVIPARRYRSRPGSALDRINRALSSCGCKYVLRTGASCRDRPIPEDCKNGIGVQSYIMNYSMTDAYKLRNVGG